MERGTYTYGTGGGGHGAEVEEQAVTAVAPRFLGVQLGVELWMRWDLKNRCESRSVILRVSLHHPLLSPSVQSVL